MGRSVSTNYTRQKSHYGGVPGMIQIHTVPGLGFNNDPTTAVFRDNLPAGYLKCDGTVKNAKDYYLLAQILGVGDECRFKKPTTTLRNPDPDVNDLGSFQLPDLGSKVILGSRGTGEYAGLYIDRAPNVPKVGVEVFPQTNVGERINVNYIGNMTISPSGTINFNGSPKYNMDRKTSAYTLGIDEFQAHSHTADIRVLNYTAAHDISGQGKGNNPNAANASSGNSLEETQPNVTTGEASHDHTITRPTAYSSNFSYTYPTTELSLDNMTSYVDVEAENLEVLNQVVTPFIMVHYIIKF